MAGYQSKFSGRINTFHNENEMGLTSKRLAGPGFVILNIIRGMNIVCFLAVIAASIVMVVKTFTVSKVSFHFVKLTALTPIVLLL
jgi:hypothetical protein